MNKEIFLRDLSRFLSDLPPEEREQALKYYEDYFEDAGPENEQQVIQDLGSPVELANQIKASSQENIEYGQGNHFHRTSSYPDLYTQRQYQENRNQSQQNSNSQYSGNPNYQNAGSQYNSSQNYQNAGSQYNNNQNYQNAGFQYNNNQNCQNAGSQPKKSWSQDSGKVALVIVLAILAIPVGIPLICTIFALVLCIFAVCLGLIITVFALGGGLAIGGICSTIAAFTLFPVHGIASSVLVAGIGLILFAVGIFIFWLAIWFCIKFFPAAAKALTNCGRSIGKGIKTFFH